MRRVVMFVSLLSLQQLYMPAAQASVIYDWTGYCDYGCDTVTGVLTLTDSFNGFSTADPDEFISFKFNSSSGVVVLDELFEPFALNGYGYFRDSETDSGLILENAGVFSLSAHGRGGYSASGPYSEFIKRVPEPSTFGLMLLGMLSIFGLVHQKRRTYKS